MAGKRIGKILLVIILMMNNLSMAANPEDRALTQFFALIDSSDSYDTDYGKALGFLQKAEDKLHEGHSDYFRALLENKRGSVYFDLGDLENSGWYFMKAEALLSNHKDSLLYVTNKYNLGNYNLLSFKYNSALQKFFTCLKTVRKQSQRSDFTTEDRKTMWRIEAACMSSIGSVFLLIHQEEDAIGYYIRALDVFQRLGDDLTTSHCYTNIGEAYINMEQYDVAKVYLDKGNAITLEIGRTQDLGLNHQLYGRVFLGQNLLDSAEEHFSLSEKYYEEFNREFGVYETRIFSSQVFLRKGEDKRAEELIIGTIAFFEEIDVPKRLAEAYEVLSSVYMKQGRVEEAFEVQEKELKVRNRLVVEAEQNMANEMVSFIHNERNEFYDSLSMLQQDIESKQTDIELQKKSYANQILIISVASLGVILVAVLFFLRRNRRINRLLNTALDDNKILFQEVHHRVKNNFQIISSLLNLQIGQTGDRKSTEHLEQMKSRILSMSFVHEMLYKTNNANEIEFIPYVEELTQSIISSFSNVKGEIKYNIKSHNYLFDLDTAIPLGLILNEAITNSTKYAFEGDVRNPTINIEIAEEGEQFLLTIQDNGRGFDLEAEESDGEKLGLELIEILASQLDGHFEMITDSGTTIKVWFRTK